MTERDGLLGSFCGRGDKYVKPERTNYILMSSRRRRHAIERAISGKLSEERKFMVKDFILPRKER